MIRAHQPGSEPIDIPETIPNPVVVPKPLPTPTEPAPKEPVRIPAKGYGFIQPQAGGKDVFVHISAVERAGLSTLNEGQQIEYEIEENRGKTSAVNLKVK